MPQVTAWGGDSWGQATHCQGQLGQCDWWPGILSLPGCRNWALKVSTVLRGAGLGGEPVLELMPPSISLDSPRSRGGAEVGPGGAGFALVPHPHPQLPPDTAVGPCGCSRAASPPAAETPPAQGRVISHGFSSTPSPSPPLPLAPLGSAPSLAAGPSGLGSALGHPPQGICTTGWARGKAGVLRRCRGCSLRAGKMLEGCSKNAGGMLRLPSGKARHPPGVMDPQCLH